MTLVEEFNKLVESITDDDLDKLKPGDVLSYTTKGKRVEIVLIKYDKMVGEWIYVDKDKFSGNLDDYSKRGAKTKRINKWFISELGAEVVTENIKNLGDKKAPPFKKKDTNESADNCTNMDNNGNCTVECEQLHAGEACNKKGDQESCSCYKAPTEEGCNKDKKDEEDDDSDSDDDKDKDSDSDDDKKKDDDSDTDMDDKGSGDEDDDKKKDESALDYQPGDVYTMKDGSTHIVVDSSPDSFRTISFSSEADGVSVGNAVSNLDIGSSTISTWGSAEEFDGSVDSFIDNFSDYQQDDIGEKLKSN